MPTSARPYALLVTFRRAGCPHTAVPGLAPHPCKRCHCEPVTDVTGVAIRNPLCTAPLVLPPAGYFLPSAAESTQRTPPKPRFWNPSAPEMRPVWKTSCHANQTLNFNAVLSYRPCVYIRWPLTRTRAAPVEQGCPQRLPRRRRTRRASCHAPVGADAYIGPPPPHYTQPIRRGDPRGRPPALPSVGAGFSCPPSCQPIPGHCRVRQSGHFLETGSLLPPPAALRRFPRRPGLHHTPLQKVSLRSRCAHWLWRSVSLCRGGRLFTPA